MQAAPRSVAFTKVMFTRTLFVPVAEAQSYLTVGYPNAPLSAGWLNRFAHSAEVVSPLHTFGSVTAASPWGVFDPH